jgi:hypothetical protein
MGCKELDEIQERIKDIDVMISADDSFSEHEIMMEIN